MRVHDIFPRQWISGQFMTGPTLTKLVKLETAIVHPRVGVEERVYILRLEVLDSAGQPRTLPGHERTESGYGLILTRRLAEQIAAAVGTDVIDDWPGKLVVLEPATLAGKRVLIARAPKRPIGPAQADAPAD